MAVLRSLRDRYHGASRPLPRCRVTLDLESMNTAILVGAAVLMIAVLAVRASVGMGFPSLLIYLLIGVLMGSSGLGIDFSDPDIAAALGMTALAIILGEGGLTTNWKEIKPVLRMGLALSTIGITVSVLVVALSTHYLLGMSWQQSMLLGAIISSTDAAAVFSVLRRVPVVRRLGSVLEAESGFNDAPAVVLVTLISAEHTSSPLVFVGEMVWEMAAGVAVGLVVGFCGAWLLSHIALPSSGLYPIAMMALSLGAYAGAAQFASGFAAVFVAALILGNSDLPHRAATRSFAEGLAWLAQIGLFVMLGLLVSPSLIKSHEVIYALIAAVIVTFVARPLSVLASAIFQPMKLTELSFISMAGLRGAVPIVLATIPLSMDVPRSKELFDIVFVLVVVLTLLTAPALPPIAKILGVSRPNEPRDLDVEAAPLERIAADLLQVTVTEQSLMHGVEVGELRLPKGASVSLIVRDGAPKVPELSTPLRRGDDVLIVTPRKLREETENRLNQVSRGGRLGRWLGPLTRD
ncbi:MAG: potassium/proton antiporter [Nocardioidaceae bacterium]|jgi:cell volume regulation protein A|nr:potassium/proton antiporter [Nocardioidaceae bacterium]MCB8992442.1 potassium/proton antiporter [Nocardioidaceae bacterium]